MQKRTLRFLEVTEQNNRIGVLSIRTHELVEAKMRNLTRGESERLHQALDFIEHSLSARAPGEFSTKFYETLKSIVFLASDSVHVGARAACWWHDASIPVVYMNRQIYMQMHCTFQEFAVTVLHEVLHHMVGLNADGQLPDDSSTEEARHDLQCYTLLDVPILSESWILEEHPELIKEFPTLKVNRVRTEV